MTQQTPSEAFIVDDNGLPTGHINFDQLTSDATLLMYEMAETAGDDDATDQVALRWVARYEPRYFGYIAASALSLMTRHILGPTLDAAAGDVEQWILPNLVIASPNGDNDLRKLVSSSTYAPDSKPPAPTPAATSTKKALNRDAALLHHMVPKSRSAGDWAMTAARAARSFGLTQARNGPPGTGPRFCPRCRGMREPADFYQKQTQCKACALEDKRRRRAENPGREAELARQRRARRKLRESVATSVLFSVLQGHQVIAEEFAGDLDGGRAEDLRDQLADLFMAAVAEAEDECGLEPGTALNALTAGQRHPHL